MKRIFCIVCGVQCLICSLALAQQKGPELVQGESPTTIYQSGVNIAPNPVRGNSFFYIRIDSCQAEISDNLVIYNSTGFIMQHRIIQLQPGENKFLVDIRGYGPGYYTVRLVGENFPSGSISRQLLVGM
ncbi:MAG TPA: T9SS type A sorting domain-containing protein [Puia sp.]|nr:T9SS type A sorting domain-containing protein [Puia sp.]